MVIEQDLHGWAVHWKGEVDAGIDYEQPRMVFFEEFSERYWRRFCRNMLQARLGMWIVRNWRGV